MESNKMKRKFLLLSAFVGASLSSYGAAEDYVSNLADLTNNDIKFIALDSTVPLLVPTHKDKSVYLRFPEEITGFYGSGFISAELLAGSRQNVQYAAEYTISMDESRDGLSLQLLHSVVPPIPVRTLIVRLIGGGVYGYKIVPITEIEEAWSVVNFAPDPYEAADLIVRKSGSGDPYNELPDDQLMPVDHRALSASMVVEGEAVQVPAEIVDIEISDELKIPEYVPPTDERIIGYFDLLKALLMFDSDSAKNAVLADAKYVTGYSDERQVSDYGQYEIQINQVLRAQAMDLTVMDVSVINRSDVPMTILPNRFSVRVGDELFWAKSFSIASNIKPNSGVRGFFAFMRSDDSSRNNLAVGNSYRANIEIVNLAREGYDNEVE